MSEHTTRSRIRRIVSLLIVLCVVVFFVHLVAGSPAETENGLRLWQSLLIGILILALFWFFGSLREQYRASRFSRLDRAPLQPGETDFRAASGSGIGFLHRGSRTRWVLPAELVSIERIVDISVTDEKYYRNNLKPILDEARGSTAADPGFTGTTRFGKTASIFRLPAKFRIFQRRSNLYKLEQLVLNDEES